MALSHPALAVIVMICLGFAVAGVGLIVWSAWSMFWTAYDHMVERRARRRRRVRVYLPPTHAVGRDCYREFRK